MIYPVVNLGRLAAPARVLSASTGPDVLAAGQEVDRARKIASAIISDYAGLAAYLGEKGAIEALDQAKDYLDRAEANYRKAVGP